jgi:hypothetical protein
MALSVVIGCVSVALGYRRLREWGVLDTNLEGNRIVTALGAPLVLTGLLVALLGWAVGVNTEAAREVFPHCVLILVMGLGGLLDDLFPESRPVHGFVGHFGALFTRGRLTRGVVKAVLGGIVALWAGLKLAHGATAEGIVNGLIIGLMASTVNLLDVRPGRAVKWWCCFAVLPLLVPATQPLTLPLAVAVLIYAPLDLGRRAMLGDTGAFPLGANLGFCWCMILPDTSFGMAVRILMLAGLLIMNVYAEMGSLSRVIAGNGILQWLDELWVGPLRVRREEF